MRKTTVIARAEEARSLRADVNSACGANVRNRAECPPACYDDGEYRTGCAHGGWSDQSDAKESTFWEQQHAPRRACRWLHSRQRGLHGLPTNCGGGGPHNCKIVPQTYRPKSWLDYRWAKPFLRLRLTWSSWPWTFRSTVLNRFLLPQDAAQSVGKAIHRAVRIISRDVVSRVGDEAWLFHHVCGNSEPVSAV
jgi:hypothetical protein